MSLGIPKSWRLVAGSWAMLAACGCQAPWTAAPSFSRMGGVDRSAANHEAASRAASNSPADSSATESHAAVTGAAKSTTNDQSLLAVMQEVQRAGATDPAAQQILVDQLQKSSPEMWPLVVQHFKATQNYHDQLAASTAATGSAKDAPTAAPLPSTPATSVEWPSTATNAATVALSSASPATDKIGELVDPRAIPGESAANQSVTAATPANMTPSLDHDTIALAAAASKLPQPLATDPAARPIAAKSTNPPLPAVIAPAAKQAIYDAAVDGSGAVKQALATAPVNVPTTQAASPASDASTADWQADINEAITDLQSRVSESPQTTAEVHQQASLRILQLLAGRTEDALKPIPQISHEEQDYWSGQIFALATYLDHHSQPDDKRRAAASVSHLDEAVSHLRELGSLTLRNLTFCKNVYDYGSYEPYDQPQFTPGQQVLLYVEVENYHSDSTEKGYSTSLGTSYEIFDEHGKRIEGGDFPDVDDCCRTRRRDFHIQYGLAIPKQLTIGKYRLDLNMKDRRGDKLGHASINFEVRGGKS
jgi:hypothetical protein